VWRHGRPRWQVATRLSEGPPPGRTERHAFVCGAFPSCDRRLENFYPTNPRPFTVALDRHKQVISPNRRRPACEYLEPTELSADGPGTRSRRRAGIRSSPARCSSGPALRPRFVAYARPSSRWRPRRGITAPQLVCRASHCYKLTHHRTIGPAQRRGRTIARRLQSADDGVCFSRSAGCV